ncbi:MAG: T9SS type A sorting domain-containing protein [Bacteroidetes bacterium]|nr:T9SS type A sorting domain-containing protein [Bacteroidota bacterium]
MITRCKKYTNTLFTLFLVLFYFAGNAQIGCVDSLKLIQRAGLYCQPDYNPVCGCNNVTYRNLCFSDNGGVVSFVEGICENIAIDVNPNPTINDIFIRIIAKKETNINFYIFDYWGKLQFYRKFTFTKDVYYPLNISEWGRGIYFLIAETNGDFVYKKISKQDI